jgi:hypothetical protein
LLLVVGELLEDLEFSLLVCNELVVLSFMQSGKSVWRLARLRL